MPLHNDTHECFGCANEATTQCDKYDQHICDGQAVTHWKPGFLNSKTLCLGCAAELPAFASVAVLFGIDTNDFNCAELDAQAASLIVLQRVAQFDAKFAGFREEPAREDAVFELPRSIRPQSEPSRFIDKREVA